MAITSLLNAAATLEIERSISDRLLPRSTADAVRVITEVSPEFGETEMHLWARYKLLGSREIGSHDHLADRIVERARRALRVDVPTPASIRLDYRLLLKRGARAVASKPRRLK